MIFTFTSSEVGDINWDNVDEVWCIVRSLKYKPVIPNKKCIVKHVPELSPSMDLFQKYLRWRNSAQWGDAAFHTEYVPQFILEMQQQNAKNVLNNLFWAGQEKCIGLFCFCEDELLCHRSIILGLLQGAYAEYGLNVKCEGQNFTQDDYSEFYDLYKNRP